MNACLVDIPVQIPAKLVPIFQPKRFKVMHGGRGGGKSHTVAQVLLMMATRTKLRILCVREIQNSLAESSMQVLKDYITKLGLAPYFRVLTNEIRSVNGSQFTFTGLQDHTAESIKSYEGVDIVWIEEAHSVTANSWNILIPTIRKAGSEIWVTFNALLETDYVYDRFVKHTDHDAWVVKIGWQDNPWFTAEMDAERRKLQALNTDLYNHVWEGHCKSLAGLMFKRKWFKFYKTLPPNLSNYMSSDYAATEQEDDNEPDYTEHGGWGLSDRGDLYARDWWFGQEEPDEWIAQAVAMVKRIQPKIWFEEKGGLRNAVNGALTKTLRERDIFVYRHGLPSASSKAERALGFAARASVGAVFFPETDWSERLINQLCSFTGEKGKTDDGVDVCSLIARGLDLMTNGRIPAQDAKREAVKPFTVAHLEHMDRVEADEQDRRRSFYK